MQGAQNVYNVVGRLALVFSNEREGEGYERWERERLLCGQTEKKEYCALFVVRSTTPARFVRTMNS